MHHSFTCLREFTCFSYTSNNRRQSFWGAAKFKIYNETTPRTATFSMFPVHIRPSNGLYCSSSLMAYIHIQMSKRVFCSCPLLSYCCLCILIVVYVFLDAATLAEVFPCFFLGCKAKGHGLHSSKIVVLLYILFVSYRSMYCLYYNVYCTSATG